MARVDVLKDRITWKEGKSTGSSAPLKPATVYEQQKEEKAVAPWMQPYLPGSAVIDYSKKSPKDLVADGTLPTLDNYAVGTNPIGNGTVKPFTVQAAKKVQKPAFDAAAGTQDKTAETVDKAQEAVKGAQEVLGVENYSLGTGGISSQFLDTFKKYYGYDWTQDMGFPTERAPGMSDSDWAALNYLYQGHLAEGRAAAQRDAAIAAQEQERDTALQRAYINNEKLLKYLPTQLKRAGMSGNLGATESAYIDAAAAYGNTTADISKSFAGNVSELERAYGDAAAQREATLSDRLLTLQREENARIEAKNAETMARNEQSLQDVLEYTQFNTGAELLEIIKSYEGKVSDEAYSDAMRAYELYMADPANVQADKTFTEKQEAAKGKTTTAKEDEDALAGKTSFPATDQFGNEYKIAINGQALDASEVNGSKLSKWVTEGLGYDSPYSKEIPNGTAVHPRLDRWYVYYNGEWYPGKSV
ncbi:MAG: hypothetical protein IJW97_07555 [Clostridia bacterium]|nr:hypothetical protein [Clostridia bacterium]